WDSFTLLTPNWQTRLPGRSYDGDDPDGFMTGSEIAGFIEQYADAVDAPMQTGTTVTSVRSAARGYDVVTDQGTWSCGCVVLASGACNLPSVPALAAEVPDAIDVMNPLAYRNPDELAEGGVLVVGA